MLLAPPARGVAFGRCAGTVDSASSAGPQGAGTFSVARRMLRSAARARRSRVGTTRTAVAGRDSGARPDEMSSVVDRATVAVVRRSATTSCDSGLARNTLGVMHIAKRTSLLMYWRGTGR